MSSRAEHYRAAEQNLLDATVAADKDMETFLLRAALVHAVLAAASEETQAAAWKLAHPPGARKGDGNAAD